MFKIRKGSTRIAVVLFKWIVIKFPHGFSHSTGYKYEEMRHVLKEEGWKSVLKQRYIQILLSSVVQDIFAGMIANLSEGWLWLGYRSPFLQPTLCLIFFNIQRYAGDQLPTEEQIGKGFIQPLSERGKQQLMMMDGHQFEPKNWRIVEGRLRLIDYGGNFFAPASFISFLIRNRKEIEQGTSQPVV